MLFVRLIAYPIDMHTGLSIYDKSFYLVGLVKELKMEQINNYRDLRLEDPSGLSASIAQTNKRLAESILKGALRKE